LVTVWLGFSGHSSPKTRIGTDFYHNLQYFASQPAWRQASTRHDSRNYQEDADSAVAIAAVAAATDADAEADTILAAGAVEGSEAAVAGVVSLAAEAVDAVIFDFASIELDDEDVAEDGGPTPGPTPKPRLTPRPEIPRFLILLNPLN
jgi:hypothetical protein